MYPIASDINMNEYLLLQNREWLKWVVEVKSQKVNLFLLNSWRRLWICIDGIYVEKPFQMTYTISPYYELANIMTRWTSLAGMYKSEWEFGRVMNRDVVM